jgi:hypothetical protein
MSVVKELLLKIHQKRPQKFYSSSNTADLNKSKYEYIAMDKCILSRCAADFSLLNLPKGKSLGRSKTATNS